MRLYIAMLVAAVVALAGVLVGLWWAPFVIGIAVGAIHPRARIAIPASTLMGVLAWLIPLAAAHESYGLGRTADSLATIMGFNHRAVVPIVLTLLVATLLGLCGAWLGSAARTLAQAGAVQKPS